MPLLLLLLLLLLPAMPPPINTPPPISRSGELSDGLGMRRLEKLNGFDETDPPLAELLPPPEQLRMLLPLSSQTVVGLATLLPAKDEPSDDANDPSVV